MNNIVTNMKENISFWKNNIGINSILFQEAIKGRTRGEMINGIASYTKDDGKMYCKGNVCNTCKLKEEVCINEDGILKIKYHTDFEDFQRSFNTMIKEIVLSKAIVY